jgi:hypothetical protein
MDHRYNSLSFLVQNSNSYLFTSQTFMLQSSHMGPTPMMPWGGSPIAGQPLMWLPPLSLARYWPPPPSGGYWPPPPPAVHPGQSSNTPPPPFGQGYWSPPSWAPPARVQGPPWGMPLWMTLTPQPQRSSSSPSMVSHLCLLSIVPFVIRANVERLAYSSIYVFKCPSSSARCDFIDGVLNMGGSSEGEGGGTGNDAAL